MSKIFSLARTYPLFLSLLTSSLGAQGYAHPADNNTNSISHFQKKISELERSADGRIGLSALNTSNQAILQHRAQEPFPFCSTSKFMVAAAILKKSESNPQFLDKTITYKKSDLAPYSPATEKHLDAGMTVGELSHAAMTLSDNTAMNLLIQELGGVKNITHFARSIENKSFRLDRTEPTLNNVTPGDLRDTVTPEDMGKSLYELGLGTALKTPQRNQLQTWLKQNTTGDKRIRAGTPSTWVVGDKTGGCDYGTTNDIAIIWPKHCDPIVISIYFTQNKKSAKWRDDIIEKTTRLVIEEFAKKDSCLK